MIRTIRLQLSLSRGATLLNQLLEAQRRNSIETLHLGREVGIVPKTKIIGDFVQISPFLNHATSNNSPILPEKILRVHANRFIKRDLEIPYRDTQTLCNAIDHKALIMSYFKYITPIPIDDVISLPIKESISVCVCVFHNHSQRYYYHNDK